MSKRSGAKLEFKIWGQGGAGLQLLTKPHLYKGGGLNYGQFHTFQIDGPWRTEELNGGFVTENLL